jgi:hypothetical protein
MTYQSPKEISIKALEETGIITTPEKNLRSKIDSILRSLENLTNKKLRIEFEIKKQKASLVRKRQELKKSSKSTTLRGKVALENSNPKPENLEAEIQELRRLDSILLESSNRMLE